MKPPLIEFRNLSKVYKMGSDNVHAADRISFKIFENEFVALVGQSGSGKTTCMNIIGCLDVPTSGKYFLSGRDVGKMRENELAEIRNKMIGFVFQQYNLLPKLNVLENVELSMLYAGLPGRARHKRARAVLERVGLTDKIKNRPNQLSGGQQQRVSIARALAGDPSVILADEPTGALDSHTGHEVIGLLKELNREGNTIILITHDNSIAMSANRVIRLEDGRVTYDGPTLEYMAMASPLAAPLAAAPRPARGGSIPPNEARADLAGNAGGKPEVMQNTGATHKGGAIA